jgi:hypothetical protein
MQLDKLVSSKSLCQNVCQLILGAHMLDLQYSIFNLLACEVELGVDVFAMVMMH